MARDAGGQGFHRVGQLRQRRGVPLGQLLHPAGQGLRHAQQRVRRLRRLALLLEEAGVLDGHGHV